MSAYDIYAIRIGAALERCDDVGQESRFGNTRSLWLCKTLLFNDQTTTAVAAYFLEFIKNPISCGANTAIWVILRGKRISRPERDQFSYVGFDSIRRYRAKHRNYFPILSDSRRLRKQCLEKKKNCDCEGKDRTFHSPIIQLFIEKLKIESTESENQSIRNALFPHLMIIGVPIASTAD